MGSFLFLASDNVMQHTIVSGPLKENLLVVWFATKKEGEIFSQSFHRIRLAFISLDFNPLVKIS